MAYRTIHYRDTHRSVTSTLTTAEYDQLVELADEAGLAPTTYQTQLIRAELARKKEEA